MEGNCLAVANYAIVLNSTSAGMQTDYMLHTAHMSCKGARYETEKTYGDCCRIRTAMCSNSIHRLPSG